MVHVGARRYRRDMSRISNAAFHEADGVDHWRVLFWGAHVFYPMKSYADGASLVATIAAIAEELGHFPDVDLRPEGVVVRTATEKDGFLSELDVALAQRVQATAIDRGLEPDPSKLTVVGVAVAQGEGQDVRPFFEGILGWERVGDEDLIDPLRRGPHFWFHELTPATPGRGRTHIDVSVAADQAKLRLDAALAAGGRLHEQLDMADTWTVASPDNHGVDIAGWADTARYTG
jgi:4a-hydroxytetrahydrobiopterin dehydratase